MIIEYEWVAETLDEHGDIIDFDHANIRADLPAKGPRLDIALVRMDFTGGNFYKSWAYEREDGTLMPWFTECGCETDPPVSKVPQRFHREVAALRLTAK